MRLTAAARVVLVGAVLLVVLGGVYVADRNRTHLRIAEQELYSIDNNTPGGVCFNGKTGEEAPMRRCHVDVVGMIEDWRARKGWYEYAAGALVVLTLASAFALSRRTTAAT